MQSGFCKRVVRQVQYGLADMAAMGGQQAPPQQPAAQGAPPSIQNPGGMSPAFAQAAKGFDASAAVLEQLAKDLRFISDADSAKVAMMAAQLQQMKAKQQQQMQSAMDAAQVLQGPGPSGM